MRDLAGQLWGLGWRLCWMGRAVRHSIAGGRCLGLQGSFVLVARGRRARFKMLSVQGGRRDAAACHSATHQAPSLKPPCDRWTTTRSGSGNRCRMPWRR